MSRTRTYNLARLCCLTLLCGGCGTAEDPALDPFELQASFITVQSTLSNVPGGPPAQASHQPPGIFAYLPSPTPAGQDSPIQEATPNHDGNPVPSQAQSFQFGTYLPLSLPANAAASDVKQPTARQRADGKP